MRTVLFVAVLFGAGFVTALVLMNPEPTWKFGRSTAYKWAEFVPMGRSKTQVDECHVWVQSEQKWFPCTDFKEETLNAFHVEWSIQSAQVEAGLPPK